MLKEISNHIKQVLNNFSENDSILFNNQTYKINKDNFEEIISQNNKSITFIDGGQAEIISAGNFCLSFIRVAAITFKNNKKIDHQKKEFYLFTKATYNKNDLIYESEIFGDTIINKDDLTISSNNKTIATTERAPISKISNMARRFAELALAKTFSNNIILDGTLETTYPNEEKYLPQQASALAKSSSLFTTSGNSPVILLNKIGPKYTWNYKINENTSFVKLHKNSKHVFRFEGNIEALSYLINNSNDTLFLGYPYGLILADKLARVSNEEKKSLKMQFLLKAENKDIANYLYSLNAHDILDNLS
jgi:hypothetical protein